MRTLDKEDKNIYPHPFSFHKQKSRVKVWVLIEEPFKTIRKQNILMN